MPTYNFIHPETKMKIAIRGDEPPDEATLEQIFRETAGQLPEAPQQSYSDFKKAFIADQATTGYKLKEAAKQTTKDFMIGAGYGLENLALGAKQRILEGGEVIRNAFGMESNQPEQQRTRDRIEENRAVLKPLTDESVAAKVGEFTGGIIPTLVIPGGVAGNALRRAGTAALAGAATGYIQPTGNGENPFDNALIGGVTGGAGSGVPSAGGKVVNAIKGKLPEKFQEALAKRYGIPTTLGEATGNPIVQKAETLLEQVPVIGTKGFRQKQLVAADDAAKRFAQKYAADTGGDFSAEAIRKANADHVSSLYEQLKPLARNGEISVPATSTREAASSLLDNFPDVFQSIQDRRIKSVLQNIVSDTADDTAIGKILNEAGIPYSSTSTPAFDFDTLWQLRKGLGEAIGDAHSNTARGQLKHLYGAVSSDLDNLLNQAGPEAAGAFRQANEVFKHYNVKGQAIADAYAKASGERGAGEMFSPKRFSTELKNLASKKNNPYGFSDAEVKEMTGLANIMQVVKRAGQFAENPPTGARTIPILLGGGIGAAAATGNYAVAGGQAATALVARFLTTTEAGKRLTLAASKVEPDSRSMKVLMGLLERQLPKFAATYQGTGKSPSRNPFDVYDTTAADGERVDVPQGQSGNTGSNPFDKYDNCVFR